MKTNTNNSTTVLSRWARFLGAMLMVALMVPAIALSLTVFPNPASVNLGSAGTYRVLAGTALSIGSGCTVTGNAGGASVSNLGTVTGTTDTANAAVTTAEGALTAAIANVQGRTPDSTFNVVELGGMTLGRGVYVGTGTLTLNGTLTLTGSPTDIFIIRTGAPGTSLITGASSIVLLTGGALPSNVIWQTGTTATLAASTDFRGIILAGTAIMQTAGVGASINGRALSLTSVTVNGVSVLPVELVSFTATANRMNADLRWSTATEVNNYGFEIERRQTATWDKVGFVSGAGSSNAPRNYSYTDNNLSPGRYTYRLKQVDNNGAFSYHGSVEVVIGLAPQAFALFQNYPNPFNPSTVISYQLAVNSQVTLKVYDVLGKEVATLVNGEMKAGSYTVPFSANSANGSTLASGVYIYRLNAGTFVSTKKLVLMK